VISGIVSPLMRMAVRLGAALVVISLMGSLLVRGETCESATVLCRNTQLHSMDCCQSTHCHCCLSVPVRSAPNSLPARAATTTGHEIVKVVSLPVDAMFLASGDYLNARSTARADTSMPGAAGSYLLTHAFLI
jgi:hypothetical protein